MARQLTPLVYIDVIARAGSIRKAAETLAINSTALNRRVLALEEELGVPIFERLPRGVRLSTAGELLVAHIRAQMSEIEKLQGQSRTCGESRPCLHRRIRRSLPYFLPEQISRYPARGTPPTFSVNLRDPRAAEKAWWRCWPTSPGVRARSLARVCSSLYFRHAVQRLMARRFHPERAARRSPARSRRVSPGPARTPIRVRPPHRPLLQRSSVTLSFAIEADSFSSCPPYPPTISLFLPESPWRLPPRARRGSSP